MALIRMGSRDEQACKMRCCAAELREKEGSKLAGKQEYAKLVARDLYNYMCVSPESRILQINRIVLKWHHFLDRLWGCLWPRFGNIGRSSC